MLADLISQGRYSVVHVIDLVARAPDLVAPLEHKATRLLVESVLELEAKLEIGVSRHTVPVKDSHLVVKVGSSSACWQASVIEAPRDNL